MRCDLAGSGQLFEEHLTESPGEAIEVTRQALTAGFSRIVAVGGDGTLNEVLNGYIDNRSLPVNSNASLGLLPGGTGSDFRRSIGLITLRDMRRAVFSPVTRILDAGYAEFIDEIGKQSSRYFLNSATLGFGAEVAGSVNRWREKLPRWIGGRVRFMAAAIRALHQYTNVPAVVTLDAGRKSEINTNLIVVANGRFAGGGMMLAPNASLDDGLFDVVLTDGASRIDVINELPGIRKGSYLRNPRVKELRSSELSITAERPLPIDLDGEMVGYTPARFVLIPAIVRFGS